MKGEVAVGFHYLIRRLRYLVCSLEASSVSFSCSGFRFRVWLVLPGYGGLFLSCHVFFTISDVSDRGVRNTLCFVRGYAFQTHFCVGWGAEGDRAPSNLVFPLVRRLTSRSRQSRPST